MDLFSFSFVPLLLLQASLIHPSYQSDQIATWIRILLAPIIILIAISTQSQKLFLPIQDFLHLNYALIAVPTFHVCCLATQFAFHRGPIYKHDPAKASTPDPSSSKLGSSPSVFNLIKFSLAILSSPRGLQYSWAPPQACLSRAPKIPLRSFIYRSSIDILWNHTLFIIASIYLLPVSHHPNGPVGWFQDVLGINELDRSKMFIIPTLINYSTAFIYTFLAIKAFTLLGLILDLIHILLFTLARLILPSDLRPDPIDTSLYPPMFNRLGSRDTLGDFWSKGWQCVFRRDFTFCGGTPMKKLGTTLFGPKAARPFAVMGAMIFSGIFHEWGILTVSKPDFKFNTCKFFIVQGIGLLAEDVLKLNRRSFTLTDRPILGRLETFSRYLLLYSWLCITSQGMFEALHERGLGRSGIIDPDFRNWYWFQYLLPFGPFLPRRLVFNTMMTDVA